jgi:manganese catalase
MAARLDSVGLCQRGAPDTMKAFGVLSTAATASKTIDTKAKEPMTLAIGIAVHCDGCVAYHTKMAHQHGPLSMIFDSLGKPRFAIGRIAPTARLVDQFFNDSTGEGEHGEIDARGPWNEGGEWEFVEAPAFQDVKQSLQETESPSMHVESSERADVDVLQELLIEQLQDILHAEKQLVKALPKMVKAARSAKLQQMFEVHLEETQAQVERLNECFNLMGVPAKAKPCKGMMGLLEEGQEIMKEGEKKDEVSADLALIGAAQKVEHYEMSGYVSARNLAQQLHLSAIVQLLNKSLGEEESTDQLLDQVARSLMSSARMPAAVE